MNRVYLDTLALAAQMVHAERKALAYHFARPADAPVSALNVAVITATHQKTVLVDWVSAKERYEARRQLADGLLKIDLKEFILPEQWEAFKSSGILAFTLRRDHPDYEPIFENLPNLRLTGIALVLEGARLNPGQTQIPWVIWHGGYEAIYKADGKAVYFSHQAATFTGFTPVASEPALIQPDISEKDLYAGISPFASWLLTIRRNVNLGLNLAGLTRADLHLSGYMLEG
jgi:hypothetical protein